MCEFLAFREQAEELACLQAPFQFKSNHSRFSYFHKSRESNKSRIEARRNVYDDTRFEVILMAGLPGAGKDRWIRKNAEALPVVSLDAIRSRMGIAPDKDQAKVIHAARDEARQLMRNGKPFVWNATNVTRFIRDPLVKFFHEYNARIRIVYVEPPTFQELRKRNEGRDNAVPDQVLENLANKLEVPDVSEAHEVVWVTE